MKNLLILTTFFLFFSSVASAQILDKVLKGVEKTNKILDEADKMFGNDNSSPSSSRRKQGAGFQIVSPHPDLDIQFKRCAASASTVIIDLIMTNYGDDATFYLGGSGGDKNTTLAYDDNGKQYNYRYIATSIGSGDFDIYSSAALFPTDVPIKVRIKISDVSGSAESFKRIHINMRGINDPIILYNVPITRRNNTAQIAPSDEEGALTGGLSTETSAAQATNTTRYFTHPLIDPLICTSHLMPTAIADIRLVNNDWNKLGLKGRVKQITEISIRGNENNAPEQTSYIFLENGMLATIETSYNINLFTYQSNNSVKVLILNKKDNKTSEYEFPFVKNSHYNEQGQLIQMNFSLPTTYFYDNQGACSKIIYEDEYPDNLATVTCFYTRNSQGDICSIDTETVFYEQNTDSSGKMVKGAKQETTKETCSIEYQYDDHGNWISMLAEKCSNNYIKTKRSIEYYN